MSGPLVSVIVASYNHADYLDERLASLLSQTYNNLEIIVIDDRSTDSSVNVIKRYLSDPRVILIENEINLGWIETSNRGFIQSKGKYILFANCDDSCDPRLIENLVSFIDTNNHLGLVFCRSYLVDTNGQKIGDDFCGRERSFRKLCKENTLISSRKFYFFLLHSCVIPNLSAVLINKKIFSELKGFSSNYKICADWDFYLRLSRQHPVGYLAQSLNFFRQHKKTIRASEGEEKILLETFDLLLSSKTLEDSTIHLRFRARYQVCRIFTEMVIRRSGIKLNEAARMLKTLFLTDPWVLILLPVTLSKRIFDIVLQVLLLNKKGM